MTELTTKVIIVDFENQQLANEKITELETLCNEGYKIINATAVNRIPATGNIACVIKCGLISYVLQKTEDVDIFNNRTVV